jgi:hypothetical protein
MIILRQKEYASRLLKAVRSVKRAGNSAMTVIDNAGLKTGNTIKKFVTGKSIPAQVEANFKPKTNFQINRETVKAKNVVKDAANAVKERPGAVLDDGISFAAKNPIAAAGQVGSVALPLADPVFLGVPIGTPSAVIDVTAKKFIKPYDKYTERISRAYDRSNFSRNLRRMPNATEVIDNIKRKFK